MFRLFQYRSETTKQTRKKFGFLENTNWKTTETDWVSLCFGSNQEKKLAVSRASLIVNVFWRFFGLFRQSSICFGCFNTDLKHKNKPKKMFFGFARQTEKQPKQIEFRFVSVWTVKKLIVLRTPYSGPTVTGQNATGKK